MPVTVTATLRSAMLVILGLFILLAGCGAVCADSGWHGGVVPKPEQRD